MPKPMRPDPAVTYGRENWIWVPAIANIQTPKLTEVTATSALDITDILFDATGDPTQSTNRVTAERRKGDTAQYERIGTTTFGGGEMLYALSPQAAAASPGKKAWELFLGGVDGFLVRRLAVAKETDFAIGQFVDVFPNSFGPSMPTKAGAGETGEAAATCAFAITAQPAFLRPLIA